jgi:tetratricopeptide (TPR) repeat protein
MIWIMLLALTGSCCFTQAPHEVAYWYLAAAIDAHSSGQAEVADQKIQQALAWSPADPYILLARAKLQLNDKQYEAAVADCNAALEAIGENVSILMVRAEANQRLGRFEKAIDDWETIDRLSQTQGYPGRPQALNGLAYARSIANTDIKKGLNEIEQALKLEPKEPALLDTRGFLYYRDGQYAAAFRDINAAVVASEAAMSKALSADLETAPSADARRDSALDDASLFGPSTAQQREALAVMLYHRALVLEKQGKSAEAKRDLDRVRKLIGRDPDETLF